MDPVLVTDRSPIGFANQNGAILPSIHESKNEFRTKTKDIQVQRMQIPIAKGRDDLIEKLRKNDVTVLLGETRSGKTTCALTKSISNLILNAEVPQYILERLRFGQKRNDSHQPRKVTATEQNDPISWRPFVGYDVRFDERSSHRTGNKYLTVGIIVREFVSDPLLTEYSVVIVDEGHGRTLRTDLLIASLKTVQKQRNGDRDGDASVKRQCRFAGSTQDCDCECFVGR